MPINIKMKKSDLIKEHIKLIRILAHGTRKEQIAEAKRQNIELKNYLP